MKQNPSQAHFLSESDSYSHQKDIMIKKEKIPDFSTLFILVLLQEWAEGLWIWESRGF